MSTIILRAESNVRYTAFCQRAFDELKPLGFLEEQAVQTIADTQWRLNLGRALETKLHPLDTHGAGQPQHPRTPPHPKP